MHCTFNPRKLCCFPQSNYRNSSRGVEMSSSSDTINTVVVYHSGYGHTKRMAEAVADGAGAMLFAIDADGVLPEAGWGALDAADAIIFGAPTYMGGPSWQFKKFADETLRAWFELRWKDKVFG